jgi:hypothetical protein
MNTNFLTIIKKIISDQGESILAEPRRLKGWISDYAKDEPKVERLAFGRCIEYGAYTELKNAPAEDRPAVKSRLAQKLHNEEGLDPSLCADTLDLLEAALWGAVPADTPSSRPPAYTAVSPGPEPPPVSSTPSSVFPSPPGPSQPPFNAGPVLPVRKKRNALIALIIGVVVVVTIAGISSISRENTYTGPSPVDTVYVENSSTYNKNITYRGYLEENGRQYPVMVELTFENNSFKTGAIDYTANDDGPLQLTGGFSDSMLILYENDEAGAYIAIMGFESYRIDANTIQGVWQDMNQQDRILAIWLEKYHVSN